ncbi:uncharacterized protein NMK_2399 [Novimethylophilus kurashikiensis]|uniref:Uncharacterized protein n=1 Tax=Novimethylophilus kurashikiensis TaxID=1825523 RepID=A0A2R5FB72_9PROT|nr:hypothetical protein [Novimethylophilus kurashikiensis]GBG14798.1 uncharacterized protein NMK_2399 [Novimethylophilus kurashikiensis]
MSDTKLNSVLEDNGYTVLDEKFGVYRLQQFYGPNKTLSFDGVGVFCSPVPMSQAKEVYLSLYDAIEYSNGSQEAIDATMESWAVLNACRLSMTGIPTAVINDMSRFGKVVQDNVTLVRPDGRIRHCAIMESGDVICYH